jgi:hypothetical protein
VSCFYGSSHVRGIFSCLRDATEIVPGLRVSRKRQNRSMDTFDTSRLAGLAITWSTLLAFDTFVFGLTLYKSLYLRRKTRMNLLVVLLRDGMLAVSEDNTESSHPPT